MSFTNDNANSAIVSSGGTDAPSQGTEEGFTVTTANDFDFTNTVAIIDFADLNKTSGYEIMYVVDGANGTGVDWLVTRGEEGTTPYAHQPNWIAIPVLTAGTLPQPISPLSAAIIGDGYVIAAPLLSVYTISVGADVPTITLPDATTVPTQSFIIKNPGYTSAEIDTVEGQTIDDPQSTAETSQDLGPGISQWYWSDGSNWQTLAVQVGWVDDTGAFQTDVDWSFNAQAEFADFVEANGGLYAQGELQLNAGISLNNVGINSSGEQLGTSDAAVYLLNPGGTDPVLCPVGDVAGEIFWAANVEGSTITLTPNGSDTIAGASSLSMPNNTSACLYSDGVSNWVILSSHGLG